MTSAWLRFLLIGPTVKPTVTNVSARRSPNTFGSVANLFAIGFVVVVLLFAFDLHRIAALAAVLWLGAFCLVGCGFVPLWLTRSLQRTVAAESAGLGDKRVAIILLGDGTVEDSVTGELVPGWLAHSRILQAAQRYLAVRADGGACPLIVAGDDTAGLQTTSVYAKHLAALGVAESDIMLETRGANTYQHAKNAKEILQAAGTFDVLLLVTSGLHMRRALLYFRNVGLEPQPVPSDHVRAEITLFPAAYNFALTDIACHQYVGMARMRLYNALGWNT